MYMKKSLWITLGIIAVVIIILFTFFGGTYNSMNRMRGEVEEKQADIFTQLQRRTDLIPNLVNTVQGYAQHEKEVFTAVSDARAKLAGAGTMAERGAADAELTSAVSRLLAIAENYPQLKADQTFISLQDELAGTENRIATSRKDYNKAAKDYNVKIRSFPANLLAGMYGFSTVDLFEAKEGSENPPVVSF